MWCSQADIEKINDENGDVCNDLKCDILQALYATRSSCR